MVTTDHDLRTLQQPDEPVELPLVDDPAVVVTGTGIGAPQIGDSLLERVHQRRNPVGRGHHVVRGDAGLAGVGELGPGDAPRRLAEVGVVVEPDRRLAAQLQRDRRQMLGRRPHHDPADRPAAGEDDVVEPLGQQLRRLWNPALHDPYGPVGEVARHEPGDQRRGGGREFARLEDSRVARRQHTGQRVEQELHRVVPRGDHQHHAERLGDQPRPARQQRQGQRTAPGPGPAPQMPQGVVDLREGHADLGELGFAGPLVQVAPEGGLDRGLVLDDQRPQCPQPPCTGGQGPGVPGVEDPARLGDGCAGRGGRLGRGRRGCRGHGNHRTSIRNGCFSFTVAEAGVTHQRERIRV